MYAIDVFKVVNEDQGMPKLYHSVAWGLPAILCITGLTILYYPDIKLVEYSIFGSQFTDQISVKQKLLFFFAVVMPWVPVPLPESYQTTSSPTYPS